MSKKYISNFVYSNEELQKQKIEAINELNKTTNELKITKQKKVLRVFSILLIFIIAIKTFFGTLELNNIFGYPPKNARYYKVTVNEKQVPISYKLRHKITIIPFLVNFNSYYLGNSYIDGDDSNSFIADDSGKYLIDIASFSCFSKTQNFQLECKYDKQNMKQNTDTKYTNLSIIRITNPYEELYNGKYINDITSYIKEKGEYHIEITAKYGLIETKIYFYILKK